MFGQCFVREILTTVQQLSYLILYVLIIILKVIHSIKQYCICWMRENNDSFILQINMQVLWTETVKDYLVSENGQPSSVFVAWCTDKPGLTKTKHHIYLHMLNYIILTQNSDKGYVWCNNKDANIDMAYHVYLVYYTYGY